MARLPVLVVLVAVAVFYFRPDCHRLLFRYLTGWLGQQSAASCLPANETLFTSDELKRHDGSVADTAVYLAYLGVVYDVTRGIKHYGPGGSYHVFAGKDATRAFVTGNFETDQQDDVTDLEVSAFSGIKEWSKFYDKTYTRIGLVIGSYYDTDGCPTDKWDKVHANYAQHERHVEEKKQEEAEYPPCNSEWSQDTKFTRFWCSKASGGVERSWVGVPRSLFSPATRATRCACVRLPESEGQEPSIEYAEDPDVRVYEGCEPHATQCLVPDPQ